MKLIGSILFSLVFISLMGQRNEHSKAFVQLMKQMENFPVNPINWEKTMSSHELDKWYQDADTFHSNYESELLSAKLLANKQKVGVQFESSANYFFREFNDVENNDPIQTFVSGGLSWDLLKEGYYANKQNSLQIQNEKQLVELSLRNDNKNLQYQHLYNRIIYWNHLQKRIILEQRSALLQSHMDLLKELYYKKEIQWQELQRMKIKGNQAKLDLISSVNYINSFERVYQSRFPKRTFKMLPIVDVEIEDALQTDTATIKRRKELKKNNIQQQYFNKRLPSFSLKGKLNYRQGSNSSDVFPSIGARLEIPIQFGKGQKEIQRLEEENIDSEELLAELSRRKEIMNSFYELDFKKKQLLENIAELSVLEEEIFKQELLYKEYLSIDFFWTNLNLLHQKQELELASLDLLKDLNIQLLKIYTKSNANLPSEIIRTNKDYLGENVYVILPDRVIDSSKLTFTSQFLRVHQFKKVYVSTEDTSLQKSLKQQLNPYKIVCKFTLRDNENILLIDLKNLKSKKELFDRIEEELRVQPQRTLLLQDIDQLIELEKQTLMSNRHDEF